MIDHRDQIRIVQETVAGKEITLAHVMGGPAPIIYQKLGLNPSIDYGSSAIGIMNMTPPESAVIASDIAIKSGNVYLGFADRFTGTLIITGDISDVRSALNEVVRYYHDVLGFLEYIFSENYEALQGDKLRLVRIRIPGSEVSLAHLIGVSDSEVYKNLGLHIGVHLGEDHTGESLGLLQFTPWEGAVVAADIATKVANVEIGFMDRFNGSLILTGERENIKIALQEVLDYFGNTLKFGACELTEN